MEDSGEYVQLLAASAPRTSDSGAVNSVDRVNALVLGPVVYIGTVMAIF